MNSLSFPLHQVIGLAPKLKWIYNSKTGAAFRESCLKHDKATFIHRNRVNLLITYELDTCTRDLNICMRRVRMWVYKDHHLD